MCGRSNVITEKAYWKDPVQVFSGLTWFFFGCLITTVIALFVT